MRGHGKARGRFSREKEKMERSPAARRSEFRCGNLIGRGAAIVQREEIGMRAAKLKADGEDRQTKPGQNRRHNKRTLRAPRLKYLPHHAVCPGRFIRPRWRNRTPHWMVKLTIFR
jgi:hypothetical protein